MSLFPLFPAEDLIGDSASKNSPGRPLTPQALSGMGVFVPLAKLFAHGPTLLRRVGAALHIPHKSLGGDVRN
jgi:hypothetical protein